MSFKIITDSAANLTRQTAFEHEITVIALPYFIDGKEHDCLYSEDFDDQKYYQALKDGMTVTTSQINPQHYIDIMEPFVRSGENILYIGMSSGISGAFASAIMAKEELSVRYPDREICLFDTLAASLGEGLQVLRAAKYRDAGKTLDETCKRLERVRSSMHQIFVVDDLKYLRRTGRISGLSSVIGSVLGVRPVLKGDERGKIVMVAKTRGKKSAIELLVQKYRSLAAVGVQKIGISYAGCRQDAELLISLIKSGSESLEILTVKHEPATGAHLGPGALALYFEGATAAR